MTLNPYSLPSTNDRERYYTDDITLLPFGTIWRSMRGQAVITRTLVFLYFTFLKVLGKRMPANYGTRHPPCLTAIPKEQLPDEAAQAMADFTDACQAAGMEHMGYYQPSWIGRKRGVLSVSMDPQRTMWCTTTWFEIQLGEQSKSRAVFACHSETIGGEQLNTSVETAELWIPQMIPPNVTIDRIASDSAVASIIDHHRATIANRTDMATFDPSSLVAHIERRSLEVCEFMVAKGFYAELTPEEIDQLRHSA
ncbi:hypothetical protein [Bremerella sp.]|uniref:hypothetical protein n=1 Tax=Bremerella sp. TaxID=2795602 RepID=UPI00391C80B3